MSIVERDYYGEYFRVCANEVNRYIKDSNLAIPDVYVSLLYQQEARMCAVKLAHIAFIKFPTLREP